MLRYNAITTKINTFANRVNQIDLNHLSKETTTFLDQVISDIDTYMSKSNGKYAEKLIFDENWFIKLNEIMTIWHTKLVDQYKFEDFVPRSYLDDIANRQELCAALSDKLKQQSTMVKTNDDHSSKQVHRVVTRDMLDASRAALVSDNYADALHTTDIHILRELFAIKLELVDREKLNARIGNEIIRRLDHGLYTEQDWYVIQDISRDMEEKNPNIPTLLKNQINTHIADASKMSGDKIFVEKFKTPSNVKLHAEVFKEVYKALYDGQSSLFKINFLNKNRKDLPPYELIKQIELRESNNKKRVFNKTKMSRTLKAWELTKQICEKNPSPEEVSKRKQDAVEKIHKESYANSGWWKKTRPANADKFSLFSSKTDNQKENKSKNSRVDSILTALKLKK